MGLLSRLLRRSFITALSLSRAADPWAAQSSKADATNKGFLNTRLQVPTPSRCTARLLARLPFALATLRVRARAQH